MSELEELPVWHSTPLKPERASAGREPLGTDLLARGNVCYSVGDYGGAVGLYGDALLQAVGDPAASCALLLNRSAAHAGLHQWQASLADADKATAAGGNSARSHYRRGMALAQLARSGEAAAAFQAGLIASPGSVRLAAAMAGAEAAARAAFQQRRVAAGAAAQGGRHVSVEQQAGRDADAEADGRQAAQARQAAVQAFASASDPAAALRRTMGSSSQAEGSTSGLPESARAASSNGSTSGLGSASVAAAAVAAAVSGGGGPSGACSLYKTLGVAPGAGGGEIRRAYWRQATLTHPDKGGSNEAFAQVRTAYEVLSDPLLRSLYDTKLSSRSVGGGGESSGAGNAPAVPNGSPTASGTDDPMEAEDAYAQRQRDAAVIAHKDGRSAFWKGNFRAAVEYFTHAIRAFRSVQSAPDPDCDAASAVAQTFLERCRAHMLLSQALQAEGDAEDALATLPPSLAPAGHLWLGRARLAQGNWADAAAAFCDALHAIGGPQDSGTAEVAAQARGPSPREAARRSPLAPADALQAARALLCSRDSSFDTADAGDCNDPKRRCSAETAPRGFLRMAGGRRVRSFNM
ncbi:hypothetical protein WJX81_000529 [Elliptochloris bilobata]|uniref:J domain-containing protein n=1 Tax=Elliptochloris bilobata TaxID=381761 RepID=A0AAW1QWZ3_9CHLO